MEKTSIFGLVDVRAGCSVVRSSLSVEIPAREVLLYSAAERCDFLVVGVNFPQQCRHNKQLCMITELQSAEERSDSSTIGIRTEGVVKEKTRTNVLITTSCGSARYFRTNKTFNMVASSPFREDMLSAKRQLIGMLGALEPAYLTLAPKF